MFDGIDKWPVYQKAHEILVLAEHICESLKANEQKEHIEHQILSNAIIVKTKIASAAGCTSFSHKIENLLKIKFAIREMFEGVLFAQLIKINPNEYVQLMRNAIEEFRLELVKWVRTFDPSNDIKDDWPIRFVIDQTDDFKIKLIPDDTSAPDPEDPDSRWFDWDDEDL